MKIFLSLVFCGALLSLSACDQVLADNPKIVNLSKSEKTQALALVQRRQEINLKRARLDAQYQADVNRLNEEMQAVGIDASTLCFELRKAHQLSPGINYQLDEFNARLVKQ
jgi:hypothetical protein